MPFKLFTGSPYLTALTIVAATGYQGMAFALTGDFSTVRFNPRLQEFSTELKKEVRKARRVGRIPIVYFHAEWCPPCRALREGMDHPPLMDAFKGIHLIELDADKWAANALQAKTGFRLDAVPTFFAVDREGRPVARITGDAWGADTPENMAVTLKRFFESQER